MELSNVLSTMGITVERQHHEVGSAQNEITIKYANPLAMSDSVMRYKFAAKAVADKKYGWIATFMPKPWHGKPGSGMHIHLGLSPPKSRKPVLRLEGYAPSRRNVGISLRSTGTPKALCAIVAPSVNGYKASTAMKLCVRRVEQRNRSALVGYQHSIRVTEMRPE
jgi:glutamine synthetase